MPGSMFRGFTAPQQNGQYLNMIMNLLGKAGEAVSGAVKTGQQNSVANQFMKQGNTANAPRAGLVDPGIAAPGTMGSGPGTTPDQRVQMFGINNPGVSTAGTQPLYPTNTQGQLGGTPELSMAMQLQKQQAAQQQQNMAMQMHQQQMGMNNTKQQYLQQYGTESPGSVRQPANANMSQDPNNPWHTANGQPPEYVMNNASKVNESNQSSLSVFHAPMTAVLDSNNGKWVPSMTNDPQNPQTPPAGQKPLYYVNPRWEAVTGVQGSGAVPGEDYNKAMGSINSGMAIHKTMRQHYQGGWDSLLDSGGNPGPSKPNNPNVAGQGPGKNTSNAPGSFINSIIPGSQPNASAATSPQVQAQAGNAPQGSPVWIQGKQFVKDQSGQLIPVQ